MLLITISSQLLSNQFKKVFGFDLIISFKFSKHSNDTFCTKVNQNSKKRYDLNSKLGKIITLLNNKTIIVDITSLSKDFKIHFQYFFDKNEHGINVNLIKQNIKNEIQNNETQIKKV